MAADPESADLIEKLLSSDDPYPYEEIEQVLDDDPNDSDYRETPARKKPRNAKSRGRKGSDSTSPTKGDMSEGSRRRRKDSGQHRGRGRFWTEEEEALFLQALEMYGRDWKRCAEYVGSRDARSVTSHAQKHFIKLCLHGKPLPAKVAESGLGYTLSGKPLDPLSAAAQSYGFRDEIIRNLTSEQLGVIRGGIIMENVNRNPEAVAEVDMMAAEQEDAKIGVEAPNATIAAPAPHIEQPSPNKATSAKDESWEYIRNMRTDYALNRPQRAATRNRRVQMGSTSESIQLVECEEFMKASDGEGIEQPFTIDITAEALLLMDFHAHLSEFEVIGLLAGKWDADRRHLSICEAIPCQRAQGSETRTSVELDPASEVQARSEMVEKGLVGSGWYHSHPVFSATPSLKDIENQRNYQTLFRREDSHVEPFVGWIISPYDPLLPSPISRMCGFFVLERSQGIKPFRLKFDVVNRLTELSPNLLYTCARVLEMTKSESGRMELTATWREWTSVKDEQQTGGPLTKLDKMKLSLTSYFEDNTADGAEELGEALERKIEETWGVTLTEKKTEIPTEETVATDANL